MNIKKITEEEVRSLWVQRLSDTPNRQGKFGTMGLSAAEMKAVYDALPLRIVEAYNTLADVILEGHLAEFIPSPEGKTLAAFFEDVTSGALASLLTVDGERTLAALAAAFDTHDHDGIFARLDEDGRLLPAYLPKGYESVFAEAERERAEAEAARAEAELLRQKTLVGIEERLEELEERADERDRRESAYEITLTEHGERLTAEEQITALLCRRVDTIGYTVENLAAAGLGVTHRFYEDTAPAYRKTVPEAVLPYATLSLLGGAAESGQRAPVSAVTSYSANLLAYPYPAARASETSIDGVTFRQGSDGSILIDGIAERNISYFLYTEHDGLALPESGVYIDWVLADGVTLYVKSGSTGAVWKSGRFFPSPDDEYYGSYAVYIYIAKGTVISELLVRPTIAYGTEVRHALPYRKPHRIEIPDSIMTLPGYGWYENILDLENGCYRQRRTEQGQGMSEEICHPLAEDFLASCTFPVDAGGHIEFENPQSAAVESTVTYVTKSA